MGNAVRVAQQTFRILVHLIKIVDQAQTLFMQVAMSVLGMLLRNVLFTPNMLYLPPPKVCYIPLAVFLKMRAEGKFPWPSL